MASTQAKVKIFSGYSDRLPLVEDRINSFIAKSNLKILDVRSNLTDSIYMILVVYEETPLAKVGTKATRKKGRSAKSNKKR